MLTLQNTGTAAARDCRPARDHRQPGARRPAPRPSSTCIRRVGGDRRGRPAGRTAGGGHRRRRPVRRGSRAGDRGAAGAGAGRGGRRPAGPAAPGRRCWSRASGRSCWPGGTTPPRRCRRPTLPELFAAQAARTPDAVAVVCGDVHCRTGSWMRGRTGWRGTCGRRVRARSRWSRLCLERSRGAGDRDAGGAGRPGRRTCRWTRTTRRSGSRSCSPTRRRVLVVTGPRPGDAAAGGRGGELDAARCDWPRCAAAAGCRPWRLRAGHPAYVIYTSGSTGRRRAWLVTHGGLANLVAALATGAGWPGRGRGCCSSPSFSFDASVLELLVRAGGRGGAGGGRGRAAVPTRAAGRAGRPERVTDLQRVPPALLAVLDRTRWPGSAAAGGWPGG